MYDITAIGEVLIDFTCTGTDGYGYPTLAAHPGGAPANFLAPPAKYGAGTAMIGKVGNDVFGRLLRSTLDGLGTDTRGLIMSDDAFTTLAFVTLGPGGEREFSFARKPGADTTLNFSEIDLSLIENTRALHFGTLSMTSEPSRTAAVKAVTYAKEHGVLISFDPNLRRPLWDDLKRAEESMLWGLTRADVVKISDDEAGFLFGLSPEESADRIVKDFGVGLCFVTCGADGCVFRTQAHGGRLPALAGITPVDTTGAGDIFGGSALWKLLCTGKRPEELSFSEVGHIARFATVCAGLSTAKFGGITSVPGLDEIKPYFS